MEDNIDVDASPIIYGGDLKTMGDELLKLVAEYSQQPTNEKWRRLALLEMAIARVQLQLHCNRAL